MTHRVVFLHDAYFAPSGRCPGHAGDDLALPGPRSGRGTRGAAGAEGVQADAGIEWPDDFLVQIVPLALRPELMAIAPSYRVPDAGTFEKLVWGIERHFKRIESALGGPVTVHGATVAYRRAELVEAFKA